MTKVQIPFNNRNIDLNISNKNLLSIIEPKKIKPAKTIDDLINIALKDPTGLGTLSNIILEQKMEKAAIVVTDITRPSPDKKFLPPILKELLEAGLKAENIMIIVALGMHRPCTETELIEKLGEDIFNNFKVLNCEPINKNSLVYIGETSWGCPTWINKYVVEADLVISTGIIEPHLWAGYSGGRKSIAIGVAGEETIHFQHQSEIFDDPSIRIGQVKGNRFHENAMEIARMAGLNFIINGILNTEGEVIKVVAGDSELAFAEGVKFADSVYNIPINEQADVVIAGVPYSKDSNLYQATRGASYVKFSPFPSVREGGMIIIPATTVEGAGQGLGEQRYYNITSKADKIDNVIEEIKTNGVAAGGHKAYLMALTLKYAEVVIVGSKTPEIVEELFMKNFFSIDEALNYAFRKYGDNTKITVIPDGFHVLTSKNKL
ncbi:MAG: hypothetical protein JM58_16605 [Peptococcaceae bacterium BICA1-8]|nr:MAG: hypothetical protein JM58_16605 [Peptococcaceae bacterium BICA1-8]